MVGRTTRRDQLWQALRTVRCTGDAQVVLLSGPTGIGKSRLAEWMVHRSVELGAGWSMTARYTDRDGLSRIPDMLRQFWRCQNHSIETIRTRMLRRRDLNATHELLSLLTAADTLKLSDRIALCRRELSRVATDRPVVVWLDDVHRNEEGLALCEAITHAPFGLPALVIATTSDEDAAAEQAWLARTEQQGAQRIAVHSLENSEMRALVHTEMGLDERLTIALQDRAHGNPLFAVHLIEDWKRRGLLRPSTIGLHLVEGAEISFPPGLIEMWSTRLASALPTDAEEEDWQAVERAAVLGQEVRQSEWLGIIALSPARAARLRERLLSQKLIQRADPERWWFVNSMLRESLLLRAQHGDRLQAHHQAVVAQLQAAATPSPARLGRHLVAAGRPDDAAPLLFRGVDHMRVRGRCREALALLDTLHTVTTPEQELHRRGQILRLYILTELGVLEPIPGILDEIRAAGQRFGWRWLTLNRLLLEVSAALRLGDTARGQRLLDEAAPQLLESEVGFRRRHAQLSAWIALREGREEDAVAAARQTKALCSPQETTAPHTFAVLANLFLNLNREAEAAEVVEEGLKMAREQHALGELAEFLSVRGMLANRQGEHAIAAQAYRDAHQLSREIGLPSAGLYRMNLGAGLMSWGRAEDGREELLGALDELLQYRQSLFVCMARITLLECAVQLNDPPLLRAHLEPIESFMRDHRPGHPEFAATRTRVAARVTALGWPEAPRVRALEETQRSILNGG